MKVLVVNAGSSSLKYQLFDTAESKILAKGNCERIGIDGSRIIHKTLGKGEYVKEQSLSNHSEATKLVVETLLDPTVGCISSVDEIEAIGHRVVHGGAYFTESVLVNDEVMEILDKCVAYAPLHTPAAIMGNHYLQLLQVVYLATVLIKVFKSTFSYPNHKTTLSSQSYQKNLV